MLDVAAPFLGVFVLVATAKPLSRWSTSGLCITRPDIWIQSTSSLSHHQPDRMFAISKLLQVLALGFLSSHLFLGSESWVGHGLEDVPVCSSRRGFVCLLPFSSSSFPLPLVLLLLVMIFPHIHWHFKNARMHPMVDIFVQVFWLTSKRSCISSYSSWKTWQTRLFSVFLCETQSQAPRSSRAIKSLQWRDRRTWKDGTSSHPLGPPQMMYKGLPEWGHWSVGYQLKSDRLPGVSNLGSFPLDWTWLLLPHQKKNKTKQKFLTIVLIGENQLSYKYY